MSKFNVGDIRKSNKYGEYKIIKNIIVKNIELDFY